MSARRQVRLGFVYAFDGSYAGLIQSRAREAGVVPVCSDREPAEAADVIVSVPRGSVSLDSAGAFVGCLTDRHTFIDFASPKIKQGGAAPLTGSASATARSRARRRTATPCRSSSADRRSSACATTSFRSA